LNPCCIGQEKEREREREIKIEREREREKERESERDSETRTAAAFHPTFPSLISLSSSRCREEGYIDVHR
jgi:hypothetical protein